MVEGAVELDQLRQNFAESIVREANICSSSKPLSKTFRMLLNTSYSSPQAWLLLAQDKGYFDEEDVALDLVTGKGAYSTAARMTEDDFDLGFGDINALVELAASGKAAPACGVFMVFNASPSAIVVKSDGPISNPSDFAGKTIIGHASDVALRTFGAFCRKSGIERSDVSVRTADRSLGEMVSAMLDSDDIDGVFGYSSTIRAALVSAGAEVSQRLRVMKYADHVPELYGSCLLASQRMIREEPIALAAIVRAVGCGLGAMIVDPMEAVDAVIRRNRDAVRGAEELRLAVTLEVEMSGTADPTFEAGTVDNGRLARAIALLVESNGLPRTPSPQEIFTGQFLP